MKNISVAHVIGCVDPRVGGPALAEERLCASLKSCGVMAEIFSFHYPYDDRRIALDGVELHHLNFSPFAKYLAGWNPRALNQFMKIVQKNQIQIIHNQGLWLFPNKYARTTAQKLNLPLITSVRGMLEPWTLKQNVFKKQLAWFLHEKANLEAANVFHATSEQEAHAIRTAGFRQPIAIIPNGVDIAAAGDSPVTSDFQEFGNDRILLFLSRIDPKKGLERLLAAWKRISAANPDWRLVIAGDGDEHYIFQLKEYCARQAVQRITWTGFVEGERKRELWNRTQLFILPSFSENFGNVIAEALAHGVPVITTEGTPWKEISDFKCGWQAKNNDHAIEQALRDAVALTPAILKEKGQRGMNLVKTRYIWDEIAKKMAATYRWALKIGEKPDYVKLD